INDEPLFSQPPVELRKHETRIGGKMEGGDNKALHGGIEIDLETQALHAGHKQAVIRRVPRSPRGDAAFQFEFAQGLLERENRMSRRSVPKLPVLLEPFPLAEQIEAQTARPAFRREEQS